MATNAWGRLYIVVVTFNRADLLSKLLESVDAMNPAPHGIIVVDNASTDETGTILAKWSRRKGALERIVLTQESNTGGAGGFSAGVRKAHSLGAQWTWVMDDDVVVERDALQRLARWRDQYPAFVPRRHDVDGKPVFWQPTIGSRMGIAPLRGTDNIASHESLPATAGCFEGMMFSREVVDTVGLPDPRFFITWDDATYGWLVSRHFPFGYVNTFALTRTRTIAKIDGAKTTLIGRTDMGRFYTMRNRALVAHYFRSEGEYRALAFGFGTFLTLLKELVRCVIVERRLRGIPQLFAGLRAGRAIRRDIEWKPWSELEPVT